MFFSPLQWAFDVFNIHLIMSKNQKLSIDQYQKNSIDQFSCWFICASCHSKNIQIPILFNFVLNNTPFIFKEWMQIIIICF